MLSKLKRQIPDISEKMLIQELKIWSASGLVKRINFGEGPLMVECEITKIGLKVLPLVSETRNFAIAYQKYQKILLDF